MPSLPSSPSAPRSAERLAAVLGGSHVLTDPALTASYEVGRTGRFRGQAALIVQRDR